VTDPYRDASGAKCPRCGEILVERPDNGLACQSGCGEWLPSGAIERMLGTTEIAKLAAPGLYFKATPLPPTRCLVCSAPLDDLYPARTSTAEPLTLGRCAAHGVWIEGHDRAQFERVFGIAIERQTVREQVAAEPILTLQTLLDRIEALEARVAELERRVD